MNPNSLKNLKKVQPGEVRNPLGCTAGDPKKRALKKLTNAYMSEIIELATMGNLAGLKAIVDHPNTPAIQVGVAKCLFEAIKRGDWHILEAIVSRNLGKTPERLDVTSTNIHKHMTMEELKKEAESLEKKLRQLG